MMVVTVMMVVEVQLVQILYCFVSKSFVKIQNENTERNIIIIDIHFILSLTLTNAFYYFLLFDKELFYIDIIIKVMHIQLLSFIILNSSRIFCFFPFLINSPDRGV